MMSSHQSNNRTNDSTVHAAPPTLRMEPSPLTELELRRHPQETRVERLAKEWLRLSGEAPVGLLKLFLSKKLSHTPKEEFQIMTRLGGQLIELDDGLTLQEVRISFCDADQGMMVLHYRLRDQITT